MTLSAITASQWAVAALFFVFGCTIGSFLNVCIWRIPRGLAISVPRRSFCPHCKADISWDDNIPLLSFVLLMGKCRRCGKPISWRYPLVEGLTGILFVLVYVVHGTAEPAMGPVIVMALVAALLTVASAIDMEFLIIPDEISLFGIAGGLLAGLLLPELHVGRASYHTLSSLTGLRHLDGLLGSCIGAVGGGGLTLLVGILGTLAFRKEAMGIGDAKLMALVGSFMGWKVAVLAFFLAPLFGLVYGVPLLIFKREHVMPYGPFLSIASVVVILFRDPMCDYFQQYVHLLRTAFGS